MFELEIIAEGDTTLNIIPEEISLLCRACLNKNGSINIFETFHNGKQFKDILKSLSEVLIEESDNMPKLICNACAQICLQFVSFGSRVKKSQNILKTAVDNMNLVMMLEQETINCVEEELQSSECKDDTDIKVFENDKGGQDNCDIQNQDQLDTVNDLSMESIYIKEESVTVNEDMLEVKPELVEVYILGLNEDNGSIFVKKEKAGTIEQYLCCFCVKEFESFEEYNAHVKEELHIRQKTICHICYKVLSISSLRSHKSIHTNQKPFECSVCNQKFRRKDQAQKHAYTHSKIKPFKCQICSRNFTRKWDFKCHIKRYHQKKEVAPATKFISHYCGKIFDKKQALNKHLYMHRKKPNIKCKTIDNAEKTYYKCEMCNKHFTNQTLHIKHVMTHTGQKPYACTLCDKRYIHPNHLTLHMNTIHSTERPFNCTYCDRSYNNHNTLKIHLRTHTKEWRCVCDVCGKGFCTFGNMNKHRKVHEKEESGARRKEPDDHPMSRKENVFIRKRLKNK